MPKWTLIILLPVLAAALVFLPALITDASPKDPKGAKTKGAAIASAGDLSTKRGSEGAAPIPGMWQIGASLAFVLTLAIGAAVVVRRIQYGSRGESSGAKIELRESRRLSKGRAIHYLRVGEHLLLVGESETGIHLLRDMTPDDDAARMDHSTLEAASLDDGATPRDLLPASARAARSTAKLGDFRALLGKLA